MKLWKLNAILIILSVSVSLCLETASHKSKMKNSHNKKFDLDAYLENDKYVNNLEDKLEGRHHHSFIERQDAAKKDAAPSKKEVGPSKKGEPSKKEMGPNIIIIENKQLVPDKKFITFTKCKSKTGYLNLGKDLSKLPKEIHVTPVYVLLSIHTINFFTTTDEKTLFNSIKIKRILRISQQNILRKKNCFDLIQTNAQDEELPNATITLCAQDETSMNEWIDAIRQFKECQVSVTKISNNQKVIQDFEKVEHLMKIKDKLPPVDNNNPETLKSKLKNLYYDNKPTVVDGAVKVAQELEIKRQVEDILQFIRKGNIRNKQIQREKIAELKEAKKVTKEVKEKEQTIKKIIEKRAEKELEKEAGVLKKETKSKELNVLDAVKREIELLKAEEAKRVAKGLDQEILLEKKIAEEKSKEMMKMMVQQEVNTPFDECTDSNLLFFKNSEYINKTCAKNFGEQKKAQCITKPNFCEMCCSHHCGLKHMNNLVKCKTRCSALVEGKDWRAEEKKASSKKKSDEKEKEKINKIIQKEPESKAKEIKITEIIEYKDKKEDKKQKN